MKALITMVFAILLIVYAINGATNKTKNSQTEKNLTINLFENTSDDVIYDKIVYTDFPVYSYKYKFKKEYNEKLKEFKGIPKLDSFLIVTRNFYRLPRDYSLYKKSFMTKSEFINRNRKALKDTMNLSNDLKFELNAVSGFLNNKQIVIVDANNNKDFSDDVRLEFNKDFRLEHNYADRAIDTIPLLNFHHQTMANGKTFDVNRKIQVFPYTNHPHTYLMSDGNLDTQTNNYTLMLRLKDYRFGNKKIMDTNYSFSLQGMDNNLYFTCVIKPDSVKYEKNNLSFQKNFQFRKNDTLILSDNYYSLDSVSYDLSKLYLNKIKNITKKPFGSRMNYRSADYELQTLDNEKSKISDISDKQYTLLDFWGTWCAPCKEVLPEVKKIHDLYSEKLDIIGIALDRDIEDVKNYTKKNNMDWSHAYVNRNARKNSIIDHLNVNSYPTFILLDKNMTIIYRGGSESLEEIEKILKKDY